ncbi:MAG: rhomboid family intramembrane serine protease [Flavobacterium sp.]|nr:rhomboid family intramembrane serine protease [Pedobacter sp.]
MNKSIFSNLYYKVVQSGNPLFLFIGINVLVFLLIQLVAVVEFLGTGSKAASDWISFQLSMPASLLPLLYKFWTVITYMFAHNGIFHILFNMLWLYWFGRIFLDFLNSRQFIFTYLAGGISGAALFIFAYNVFPAFKASLPIAVLIGSSASVMAVVAATATLLPDYTIRLILLGSVKLKYLALAYFVLDLIGIAGSNPGGSIAHIGGAILGFIYIRQLRNGDDWSKIFRKKRRLTVVQRDNTRAKVVRLPDQEVIDQILDKISKSGYDSLTTREKEQLFKASNKE